jgi:anti-anti-sigma regulatory factor
MSMTPTPEVPQAHDPRPELRAGEMLSVRVLEDGVVVATPLPRGFDRSDAKVELQQLMGDLRGRPMVLDLGRIPVFEDGLRDAIVAHRSGTNGAPLTIVNARPEVFEWARTTKFDTFVTLHAEVPPAIDGAITSERGTHELQHRLELGQVERLRARLAPAQAESLVAEELAGRLVLRVGGGRLDSEALGDEIKAAATGSSAPVVVLNLDGVTAIGDMVIGKLVRLHQQLKGAGSELRLCSLGDTVREKLTRMTLLRMIKAYPDEAAAVSA